MSAITSGVDLTTFITGLNGGVTIDPTLLEVLVATGKSVLEEERPWMVLRKLDSSKAVTTANTWQTAIDLSTIADFSKFYSEWPIQLFDGTNRLQYYTEVPLDRRLQYKDVSNTFVYDENAKILYLNGTLPFNGTLYISYVSSSTHIDLASTSPVWTPFPVRWLPLLGYYAIGIHKGAVDYDSINKLMLPTNQAVMIALKDAMEKWDNEKQLSSIDHNDPTEFGAYPRAGAVDRRGDL